MILSGGSGTRLWPLSTPEVPKQFTPLFDGQSLFGLTLERLIGIGGLMDVIVVTGRAHQPLVESEIARSQLVATAIIVEPIGRNTAPAAVAAALASNPEDVMIILPADHLITDGVAFRTGVEEAVGLANAGHLVTFGIEPDRPETGYGYIEVGESLGAGRSVARFKEKPDLETALSFSTDGMHLWNSGMFVVRADMFLDEARRHRPEIVEGVEDCLPSPGTGVVELAPEFGELESVSIDYAIMEQTDRAAVLPLRAGWSDVGSYLSLLDVSDRDEDGNHISGQVTARNTVGSFLKATSRRLVVGGLEKMIVVETPEAVLVLPLEHSQEVRGLQEDQDG